MERESVAATIEQALTLAERVGWDNARRWCAQCPALRTCGTAPCTSAPALQPFHVEQLLDENFHLEQL